MVAFLTNGAIHDYFRLNRNILEIGEERKRERENKGLFSYSRICCSLRYLLTDKKRRKVQRLEGFVIVVIVAATCFSSYICFSDALVSGLVMEIVSIRVHMLIGWC